MFRSARIKLTVWYLLIIMLVSLMFSAVIYRLLSLEIARFEYAQRIRIERRFGGMTMHIPETTELVEETRRRILTMLAIINGGILVVAGAFGYLLAGQTLQPIKVMVDEQNRFVTDASHELRTPLTALKSAMEVHLRDRRLTLVQAKTLIAGNIKDVNRLQALADALLQLARYQKANGQTVKERLQGEEIVKEAVKKIEPLAHKKQIGIKTETTGFSIWGDKYGLTELLIILLDNAVKYSPAKSTVAVRGNKTDGWVTISVTDSGTGIDKEDQPHIWDRFYRAERARSDSESGGYGLGLAIAKKIVEANRGTISFTSREGRGTTFTVRLPAAP